MQDLTNLRVHPMLQLTWSRMSTHLTCFRKDFYSYERNLRSVKGSTALRYGSVWHKILEGFYGHIRDNGWTRDGAAIEAGAIAGKLLWEEYENNPQEFYPDYRTYENALYAFIQYVDHFSHDEGLLQILAPEKRFSIAMKPSPDFPFHFEPFIFAGTLDMEVLLDGRPWLWENKSTGQALSLQQRRLHRSGQFMGYTFAGSQEYCKSPDGMLIVFHQLTAYKSKKTGEYGKAKVDFLRTPQIFSAGDLANWKVTLCDTAEDIRRRQASGIWPMVHPNCHQFGECGYSALCDQNAPLGEENTYGFYTFLDGDRYKP